MADKPEVEILTPIWGVESLGKQLSKMAGVPEGASLSEICKALDPSAADRFSMTWSTIQNTLRAERKKRLKS